MPGVTLFGVYQGEGFGFNYSYNPESLNGYSGRYQDGINPSRYNYCFLAGISLDMEPHQSGEGPPASKCTTLTAAGTKTNMNRSQFSFKISDSFDQRIKTHCKSAQEVPVQYKAASDAYLQKRSL